eukprot:TRINITY_DN1516_c0_g2_i4.p2 TRINITY_DN1516_c0_g2~~TRINITY_DN1516_c0_g2_i4.p2  ORF type:complete len:125 (-),score=0.73 TRINITY_DN1516_c0_g2_i4:152-526(-)
MYFLCLTHSKPQLNKFLNDSTSFLDFHKFLFNYHILIPGKRSLMREEVEFIVKIEFGRKNSDICRRFLEFMRENDIDEINYVEWESMPRVFKTLLQGKMCNDRRDCMHLSNSRACDLQQVLRMA